MKGWQIKLMIKELSNKFYMKLAWILPRRLVKWCGIRMASHATTGKYSDTIVPDIRFMDVLKRWGNENDRP